MKLPMEITKPTRINAKRMILYSKPKTGKTDITSKLPNSLLIDLEDGSDFVEGRKIKINNLDELKELGIKLKEANYPFEYGIIDTVTALEDMVLPYAAQLYRSTPMGKNWQGTDVKSLPNGSGYLYLREAFFKIINNVSNWFPNLIILAHLKESLINKNGEEVSAYDIDLTGKIKSMAAGSVDAVGYMYRKEGYTLISFKSSEQVVCGARSPHLSDMEIKIAELNDNGKLVTYWDEIYK